jgi:hypothetical protein
MDPERILLLVLRETTPKMIIALTPAFGCRGCCLRTPSVRHDQELLLHRISEKQDLRAADEQLRRQNFHS